MMSRNEPMRLLKRTASTLFLVLGIVLVGSGLFAWFNSKNTP